MTGARYLVDTHVLLWALAGDPRLSERHRSILSDKKDLVISAVSVWEIAIKQSLDKLRIDGDLLAEIRKRDIEFLRLTEDHAIAVKLLPYHHRDPFDRLLIAQAMMENLTILTSDSHFSSYPVATA